MELPKDRKGWLKLIGVVVALFAAYQVVKRLLPDIDPQQLLEDVSSSLGAWTYGLVALLDLEAVFVWMILGLVAKRMEAGLSGRSAGQAIAI